MKKKELKKFLKENNTREDIGDILIFMGKFLKTKTKEAEKNELGNTGQIESGNSEGIDGQRPASEPIAAGPASEPADNPAID